MAFTNEMLEKLGLSEEQVKEVMREHGKVLNPIKKDRDDAKALLVSTQGELKKYDGVDVEDLQSKITNYENSISNRDFEDIVKEVLGGAKAKNNKAVMAMLDIETLKASKNQQADIQKAVEAVKKENDYMFQGEQTPRMVSSTPGSSSEADSKKTQANEAIRSLFGKE